MQRINLDNINIADVDTYPEIQSSKNEIKKFLDSMIWRDVKAYLEWAKEGTEMAMRSATDPIVIYRSQGALEVTHDILNLPEVLDTIQEMRNPATP